MRNGSLWSNIVLRKRNILTQIKKRLQSEGIWKHTNLCNKGVFSCIIPLQFGKIFQRFVILQICWDTRSENTGLSQLPNVSSAFIHGYVPSVLSCCELTLHRIGIILGASSSFIALLSYFSSLQKKDNLLVTNRVTEDITTTNE